MPGTLLAVAVTACTATIAVGAVTAGAASAFSQHIAGVADAAALAAADAASGAITGEPCGRAREVASAAGAVVDTCALDGLIATVRVADEFGRFPVTASARAGPPGS